MILSILIPSIPERREQLTRLLDKLYTQQSALNRNHPTLGSVEILIDDSKRFLEGGLSIGAKRELLKQRSSGKYLCFLDDDDGITPNYLETLVRLCNEDQSIVTFRTLIKDDNYWAVIDMSLDTKTNTEVTPHGTTNRTPWHICPVKAEIAKRHTFSATLNHNEDWDWMSRVLKDVASQSHTDMILTQYNHSEAKSEADAIERPGAAAAKERVCLISLAIDGRERYTELSKGLEASIAKYWEYDTRLYKSYPSYCTPHNVIPYKFKFDLIRKAKDEGYTKVIWLDSSIRLAHSSLTLLFDDNGIIAFDNLGHPLWKYISDKACKLLGVSEAEVKKIPQTWGGAIGFDFTRDKACVIFEEICLASTSGAFEDGGSAREGFVSHRHDQACMSAIFWKHEIKLLPYGNIVAAVHSKPPFEYGQNYSLIYGD